MLSSKTQNSTIQDDKSYAEAMMAHVAESENASPMAATKTPELSYVIHEPTSRPWLGAPEDLKTASKNYTLYTSRLGGVPMYPEEWNDLASDKEALVRKLPFLQELQQGKQSAASHAHQKNNNSMKSSSSSLHMRQNPKCPLCKCPMKFISQLFAPLGDWDRFIYVWACCEESCAKNTKHQAPSVQSQRWKAYRLQLLYPGDEDEPSQSTTTTTTTQPQKDQKQLKEEFKKQTEEWSLGADTTTTTTATSEFSLSDQSALDDELAGLLAKNATIENKTTTTTTSSKQTSQKKPQKVKASKGSFPCYKLDIFEEPTEDEWVSSNPDSQAASIAREYQQKSHLPNQTDFTDDSAEVYEDEAIGLSMRLGADPTKKLSIDKQLLNFHLALEKCPDQSVRWEWKGKPLWSSSRNLPGKMEENLKLYGKTRTKKEILSMSIPSCKLCKNPRAFEFQILPTIIYQLYGKHVEGIDFGSVYIFTCSSSCCPSNEEEAFLQECYVHVQPPID